MIGEVCDGVGHGIKIRQRFPMPMKTKFVSRSRVCKWSWQSST